MDESIRVKQFAELTVDVARGVNPYSLWPRTSYGERETRLTFVSYLYEFLDGRLFPQNPYHCG